jgi:hypothetical protein
MENSGIAHILKNEKTDDLASMYELFSRVAGGPEMMADCVSQYLREQGKALVQEDNGGTNAINFVQVSYIFYLFSLLSWFPYFLIRIMLIYFLISSQNGIVISH